MATSHAKITRPTLPPVIRRERLFDRLDEALARPLTWVFAPAGAGKTTLLASYLENRSRPSVWYRIDGRDRDIPTFLAFLRMAGGESLPPYDGTSAPRSWLELYFASLPHGSVIVFDDYDEVSEAPLFEETFLQAILSLPDGMSMVVTSRQAAPARFARFKASRQMAELSWRELQLNLEETEGFLGLHGRTRPAEMVAAIHREIDGWPAGAVLLSLHDGDLETDSIPTARHGDRKVLFDYFSSEVFAHFSREDRIFMLKTAFLPTMTAELARNFSGERDSAGILARFHARGYFIEQLGSRGETYRYHPFFRAFLLQTALDTLLPREISTLQHEAARQLEEEGAVDDAVAILGLNGNWEFLIGMVQRNAARFIDTGRAEAVRFWLRCIPRSVAETLPAYHYWLGCCEMNNAPAEAVTHFTRAFELAEVRDQEMALEAWCGAVKAILMARDDFSVLDDWISWMDNHLLAQDRALPPHLEGEVAIAMSWALTCRQPHHPELNAWLNRMSRLTPRGNRKQYLEAQVVAANYYLWTGDMAELDIVLKELRKLVNSETLPNSTTLAAIWLLGVACAWQDADAVGAQCKAAEGLARAEVAQCHFYDHLFHATSAYAHLLSRETKQAGAAIDDMVNSLRARNRIAFAHNHFLQTWRALLDGDLHSAVSNSSQSVRFVQQTGMVFAEIQCRLAHARALHETGDDGDAQKELAAAAASAETARSPLLQCMCRLLDALMALDSGNIDRFRACAGRGFGTMKEQGYVSLLWWWLPDDMSRLCGSALEEGIETGFVMGLIRRHGLLPSPRSLRSDQWPWLIKVYTMGRFNVIIEDRPLPFSGKSQVKPLALLQAIIALGGRGVAQEQIIECLWSDADGDIGHQSFATTLHRLRKLIGHDQVILLQDGRVTLSPLFCWVDVWAFERIASQLLEGGAADTENHEKMTRQAERILTLYQGPFLGEDSTQTWTIPLRERLRSRMLRVIQKVGVLLEKTSPERATLLYEKGIETDPFIEEFYQGLMRCHAQLGRRGDVHSVYQHCGTVLKAIDTRPSLKTETIYHTIFTSSQAS